MFRRKSRSVHNTAYTGVNHTAPTSNQPNNNALAAALTIGHSLKNDGRSGSIQRSTSIQSIRRPTPQKSNTLLRRSPSMANSVSSISSPNKARNPEFRDFSSSSNADHSHTYDIDDTMNDSYLDEITEETTRHYNRQTVQDLKLSHNGSSATGHHGPPKRHSMANSTVNPGTGVKMVKKYIPTPNGIKIIEVPEEKLQREITRNNSIRSGANIPRTSSISSLNSVKRPARRQPSSRMPSLVKSPALSEMKEEAEPSDKDVSQSTLRESSPSQLEYEELERKIAEEKAMQKRLEQKRKEYEELKRKRLEHESAYRNEPKTVQEEPQHLASALPVPNVSPPPEDSTNGTVVHTITGLGLQNDYIEKPVLSDLSIVTHTENDFISPVSSQDRYTDESDYKVEVEDEGDEESVETIEEDAIPDASIDPGTVIVDELESPGIGLARHEDEDEVQREDEFGIEEGEFDDDDTPRLPKGPTFDTVPSIIDPSFEPAPTANDGPTFEPVPSIIEEPSEDLLKPKSMLDGGSSISSAGSDESPSRSKKPMKSAMKNSTSFYNSSPNPKSNAAHSAYLSLTTAENTRLNSKLSASQLSDVQQPMFAPSHHYPSPTPTTPNGKRMSTSMRNPPPQQSNSPLLVKSLRPQSMQIDGNGKPSGKPNGNGPTQKSKMSDRSLRDRSSVYVQPIAPHPALQPNYQSSSKARASQLYEKANKRPHSTFNLERKSSFSNEHNNDSKMRFSMREMVQPVEGQRMSKLDPGYQTQPDQGQPQRPPQGQGFPQQPQRQGLPQKPQRQPQPQPGQPQRQQPKQSVPQRQSQPQSRPPSRVPNNFTSLRQPQNPAQAQTPSTPSKSRIVDSDDEIIASPDSGVFSSKHGDSDDEGEYLPYSHPKSQYRQFRESKQILTLRDQTPAKGTQKQPKDVKEKKKFSGRLKKIFGRS